MWPNSTSFMADRSAEELYIQFAFMNHKDYNFKFQNRVKGWGKILMLSFK